MKMTKIGMISSNAVTIIAFYLVLMVAAMALTFERFNLMVTVGLGVIVVMIIHLAVNATVSEKRFYEKIADHVFVADWGPFGRLGSLRLLPTGLKESVIFVPASQVRTKAEEVKKLLRESGNPMFEPGNGRKGIEVKMIFFARGEHLDERWSPKKYKKRLFNTVAESLVEFHTEFDRANPDSKFSKEAYDKIYIDTHLNGSAW